MDRFTHLHEFDTGIAPVVAKARDYPAGEESPRHAHPTAQLLYAVEGVMVVTTEWGQWIVPPTRGIWLPIRTWHQVRMVTPVRMRTVYVRADSLDGLPEQCRVLAITPLMRELILAAMSVPVPAPPKNGSEADAILDSDMEHIIHLFLLNRGLLITPFHNMILVCPDTKQADVDQLVSAFDEFVREVI